MDIITRSIGRPNRGIYPQPGLYEQMSTFPFDSRRRCPWSSTDQGVIAQLRPLAGEAALARVSRLRWDPRGERSRDLCRFRYDRRLAPRSRRRRRGPAGWTSPRPRPGETRHQKASESGT